MRQVFILLNLLVLFSCESKPAKRKEVSSSLKEIKRMLSPNKRVEAVLIEDEGNATVANFIQVYIVLPGAQITEGDRIYSLFNADQYSDVNIEWKKERNLVIQYSKARIFKFSNFWQNEKLDNWNYNVELTLHCTSPDGQLYPSQVEKGSISEIH